MLKRLIYCDLKTVLRIPIAVFFSNIFPLVMASILIFSIGNIHLFEDYYFVDKYYSIALVIGILPLSLISLPMSITNLNQTKLLERYYLHGIKPTKVVSSILIVHFILGIFEFLLITIFLKIVFGLNIPGFEFFLSLLINYSIVLLVMLLVGLLLGIIINRREITQVVGISLMFLLFFICGIFGDFTNLPSSIQFVGELIPIKYLAVDSFNIISEQLLVIDKFYLLSLVWIILFALLNFALLKRTYKMV